MCDCVCNSYENREPRVGIEDGKWNEATCFVFITCTMVNSWGGSTGRHEHPCLQREKGTRGVYGGGGGVPIGLLDELAPI